LVGIQVQPSLKLDMIDSHHHREMLHNGQKMQICEKHQTYKVSRQKVEHVQLCHLQIEKGIQVVSMQQIF